jgi:hypothetical protein
LTTLGMIELSPHLVIFFRLNKTTTENNRNKPMKTNRFIQK